MSGGNTAAQINTFLKKYGSPMVGLGQTYVATGRKYGVDPRLVVAISGIESSFGKSTYGDYNAWGWGPGRPFSSWEEGISTVTRGLKSGYIDEGRVTPAQIVSKYAPKSDGNNETHWSSTVGQFMRELGASPATSVARAVPSGTGVPSALEQQLRELETQPMSMDGLRQAALENLADVARTGKASGLTLLRDLSGGVQKDRATDLSRSLHAGALRDALGRAQDSEPPPTKTVPKSTTVTPAEVSKWARLAPGADRAGVSTNQGVFDIVAEIARQHGEPLTISTGTNHNQYVSDSNPPRESAHWQGNAADVVYGSGSPGNVDPALTRLGRAALIAAGMDWREASKQTGGVFNVGGYQILFNTTVGGNHYNHLHVGLSGATVGVKR